jgi:hypothetical protein
MPAPLGHQRDSCAAIVRESGPIFHLIELVAGTYEPGMLGAPDPVQSAWTTTAFEEMERDT